MSKYSVHMCMLYTQTYASAYVEARGQPQHLPQLLATLILRQDLSPT